MTREESEGLVDLTGWKRLKLCDTKDLNCKVCLGEGGQSFTWEALDPYTWYNVLNGHCCIIRQCNSEGIVYLYLRDEETDPSVVLEEIKDYLRLNEDLEELCREWSKSDPKFPQNLTGIRLLRQDPLETLFAFICSQNNIIVRIKLLVRTLKRNFGELIGTYEIVDSEGSINKIDFYAFPRNVSAFLGSEAKLREWKFGYRAKYISSAAAFLSENNFNSSGDLNKFRLASYEESVTFLRKVPGIGPKVADCVALMSLDQLASVPIDTHIWRIAVERYKFNKKSTGSSLNDRIYREIGDKFRQLFGSKAGWAHSVLFTAELRPFKSK